MKKIYFIGSLFICICLASVGMAAEKMITIPESAYETILQRLDTLQKKVDHLEQADQKSIKKEKQLVGDINDIYDTLDEVETKTIKDRINWGAELRTRVDNYKISDEMNMATGRLEDYSDNNRWTNRFRFNFDAKVIEGLLFHGRLTAYKNWSTVSQAAFYPYADPNLSHVPGDTSLKVDRAYIDWVVPNMPIPIALTIGRQPASEGPPAEFKENRLRQSTYPVLLFDGEADGIVATIGLDRFLPLNNSALRIAYGKGYQSTNDKTVYLGSRYGIDDLNVFGTFFEAELPGFSNSLMVLSYVRGNDFVDSPVNPGKNLGDMDLFGFHVQAPKLLDSGLDLFFSWGMNKSHPNGQFINMPVGGMTIPMGLLSSDGQESQTGWSVYAGLRYTLPIKAMNSPKLGFEYNHGSKYWFSFTQGSTELYNKLATRGDVFDFYYIQPFNKYLYFRAGYTIVNTDYTGSGWHIGEPMDSKQGINNLYFLLDCRF